MDDCFLRDKITLYFNRAGDTIEADKTRTFSDQTINIDKTTSIELRETFEKDQKNTMSTDTVVSDTNNLIISMSRTYRNKFDITATRYKYTYEKGMLLNSVETELLNNKLKNRRDVTWIASSQDEQCNARYNVGLRQDFDASGNLYEESKRTENGASMYRRKNAAGEWEPWKYREY